SPSTRTDWLSSRGIKLQGEVCFGTLKAVFCVPLRQISAHAPLLVLSYVHHFMAFLLRGRKVIVKSNLQMDSSCAMSFLLGDPPYDARHKSCIIEARQLLTRDWEVVTSHIYREGNIVADLLAHYGH
ncbi:hypothetical protein LINGRAHAP2_LOCUS3902, partial [Linum grandiflorum]